MLEWENAEPFQPFRLHLSDGRHFDILNANLVWTGRRTVMIGFPDDPTEPDVPSLHKTIDLLHIVSIEPVQEMTAGGGASTENGGP